MSTDLLPARLGRATRAASISDETVGIVGAGAFATALASVISARGMTATLYSEDQAIVRDINLNRRPDRANRPRRGVRRMASFAPRSTP